jgi:hypothetical protein
MSNTSTNFLNSKQRRIFLSAAGKYFAKTEDGKRVYKPKAAFRKVGAEGSVNKLVKTNVVPNAIRPAAIAGRATRKNAGVPRMTEAKAFQMIFPTVAGPKVRKVRANKGVARGPREGAILRMIARNSNRLAAKGPRKVRSNKGVARGPREGYMLKKMAAQSNRLIAGRARRTSKKVAMKQTKNLANSNPFSLLMRK